MPRTALPLLLLFLFAATSSAQNPQADSLLNAMRMADGPGTRINLLYKLLYEVNALSPQERLDYSRAILYQSKEQGDRVMESVATAELGFILAEGGNYVQGTELTYAALEMAQQHGHDQALGVIYDDLAYCLQTGGKVREYLHRSLAHAEAAGDHFLAALALGDLSYYSTLQGQRDSALYFAQREYELCVSKNLEYVMPYSLAILARVHRDLYGDKSIGNAYFKKALDCRFTKERRYTFVDIHALVARALLDDGLPDSALYHTTLAYNNMAPGMPKHTERVYGLYKDIYANANCDSAAKYTRLHEVAQDSLAAASNSQEVAVLQLKKEIELDQENATRAQNLQFAFIAVGIIAFVIIFLLLSRSVFTNTRVISFLGVVALLIVFEFLNLLLHPFLERVTHHSPVLMLLALVCIAALLVPLHHKLEKWATAKLVEKNKAIRIAQAKKTLEQLGDRSS